MARVDGRIAALAATQHGLVTKRQSDQLGLTRAERRSRVASGQLVVADEGVLRIGGAPITYESRVLAAVLAAGPGALASHRTAAALWGLDGFRPGVLELSIPRGRKYRRRGIVVHESTDLERCRPTERRSIPVTDPARTLLDVALRATDGDLLVAIESARRVGQVTWQELIDTLRTHARRGRAGGPRLRQVLAENIDRKEVTDSGFEALVLTLFAHHGLPTPVLHHKIFDANGRLVAVVDLAYPEQAVAIELDGVVHLRKDVWERDRPRQNQLELLGWTVLRFTWRTYVDRPMRLLHDVESALRVR